MARDGTRRRARQGAGARSATRGGGGAGALLKQLPWRVLESPFQALEVLSPEQIELITDTAFRILEEVGMDFLHPEALELGERRGKPHVHEPLGVSKPLVRSHLQPKIADPLLEESPTWGGLVLFVEDRWYAEAMVDSRE